MGCRLGWGLVGGFVTCYISMCRVSALFMFFNRHWFILVLDMNGRKQRLGG